MSSYRNQTRGDVASAPADELPPLPGRFGVRLDRRRSRVSACPRLSENPIGIARCRASGRGGRGRREQGSRGATLQVSSHWLRSGLPYQKVPSALRQILFHRSSIRSPRRGAQQPADFVSEKGLKSVPVRLSVHQIFQPWFDRCQWP